MKTFSIPTVGIARIIALCGVALCNAALCSAAHYEIDQDHTSISFRVRHLVSHVQGNFKTFSGSFDYEPGQTGDWKVHASIDAKSVSTNSDKRDNHLRSSDFFDVEKNPKIEFVSTGTSDLKKSKDGERLKLQGLLTMRGVTKPVTLHVEVKGIAKDPWGNTVLALTAKTNVNRKDFGINWNKTLDKGGVLVGDEVEIQLDVEARQK